MRLNLIAEEVWTPGTKFIEDLHQDPAIAQMAPDSEGWTVSVAVPINKWGETILLVEDEAAIMEVCKTMLEEPGFTAWLPRSRRRWSKDRGPTDPINLDIDT